MNSNGGSIIRSKTVKATMYWTYLAGIRCHLLWIVLSIALEVHGAVVKHSIKAAWISIPCCSIVVDW